jgi:hypothetical protein
MKKNLLILLGFIASLNWAQAQDCQYQRCIQVFDVRDSRKFFEEVSNDKTNFFPFTDADRKSWGLENPIARANLKIEAKTSEGGTVEVSVFGILYPSSFEFFWNFPDTTNDLKTIVFDRNGFITNFLWYKRNKNDNWIINLSYSVNDKAQRDLEKSLVYIEEGKKFLFSFDVKLQVQREFVELEKAFPLRR